jgi:hypothetical protein
MRDLQGAVKLLLQRSQPALSGRPVSNNLIGTSGGHG